MRKTIRLLALAFSLLLLVATAGCGMLSSGASSSISTAAPAPTSASQPAPDASAQSWNTPSGLPQPGKGFSIKAAQLSKDAEKVLFPAVVAPGARPDSGAPTVGFIDENGAVVIGAEYYDAQPFSEGLAAVLTGEGWVYINADGAVQFGATFASANPFEDGCAVVRSQNGTAGVITVKGDSFTLPAALWVDECYADGLLKVSYPVSASRYSTRSYGFVNQSGQVAIPPAYSHCSRFSEGLAAIQDEDGLLSYIDTSGKRVLATMYQYDTAEEDHQFSSGLARVTDSYKKEGFINKKGEVAVPCIYEQVQPFSEGLAAVCIGNKWGFVNSNGAIVCAVDYDKVLPFSEGLAAAYRANPYNPAEMQVGFVNMSGKVAVDFLFTPTQCSLFAFSPSYCMHQGIIQVYYSTSGWGGETWYGYVNNLGERVYASPAA